MKQLIFVFLALSCTSFHSFSQSVEENPVKKKTKFQAGLYLGSYFANKYTAALYDGYGYNAEGNRNEFKNNFTIEESSFMYRKIILEYGGAYGQTDYVAAALGVDPGEWTFDETDMPLDMKYNPAFTVGASFGYEATKQDALLLNVNATRLSLTGAFTIVLTDSPIGPQPPGYQNIQTFAITGGEQRLIFQAGYRRTLSDDAVFNFFIEGGPSLSMTEYLRNSIAIKNLYIDLGSFYTQNYYTTYRAKYLSGVGLGAFAGFGMNINANASWAIQLLYSPSYEKINIGEAPKHTLQHGLGIRTLYTL